MQDAITQKAIPASIQQREFENMLVLSRQKDESIMIGDEVEITIVDVRGDKVRLGINAPRSVAVHRKEIYLAIQKEKEQDSSNNSSVNQRAIKHS